MRGRVTQTLDVRHCSAHLRSFAVVRHKLRDSSTAPRSTRNDKMQAHARLNDADVPSPSSARAALKFCVLQTWLKAGEINHEEHKGHKEFAVAVAVCATLRHPVASRSESTEAKGALEKVCRIYWWPLYGFVRREGYKPEEAQDLTQAFFARLLERRDLETVRQERGLLRSYLLASIRNFLSKARHREM